MTDYHTRLRTGVVLSSGGIRGVYAHTGFLLALQQLGINISALAGCSAGAIVGGVYASGTNFQTWVETLLALKQQQFWTPSLMRFFASFLRQGRGYTGLSPTRSAMNFCAQQFQAQTFEACQIPFYVLAKNLATGDKTVFDNGLLVPPVVASAAVPLIYEPVEIDAQFYCDGALLDLAPTDAICCKHKLDILIVHHVAQRNIDTGGLRKVMQRPWALLNILNMLLYQQRPWYLSDQPLAYRRCPCGCDAIIVVIEPTLAELSWPEIQEGPKVMETARQQGHLLLGRYIHSLQQFDGSLSQLAEDISAEQRNKSRHCPVD